MDGPYHQSIATASENPQDLEERIFKHLQKKPLHFVRLYRAFKHENREQLWVAARRLLRARRIFLLPSTGYWPKWGRISAKRDHMLKKAVDPQRCEECIES